MPLSDLIQIVLYLGLVVAVAKPVGLYLYRVFSGERTFVHPVLGPVEKGIYRFAKVDPDSEMSWAHYTTARARLQCHRGRRALRPAAPPGHLAAES